MDGPVIFKTRTSVRDVTQETARLRSRATRVNFGGFMPKGDEIVFVKATEDYEARGIYSFPLYLTDQSKIPFANKYKREAMRLGHLLSRTTITTPAGHWQWLGTKSQNKAVVMIDQKRYNPVIGWACAALCKLDGMNLAEDIAPQLDPFPMCGERFCVNPRHWEFHDPRLPPSLPLDLIAKYSHASYDTFNPMDLPICWNPPYWGGIEEVVEYVPSREEMDAARRKFRDQKPPDNAEGFLRGITEPAIEISKIDFDFS